MQHRLSQAEALGAVERAEADHRVGAAERDEQRGGGAFRPLLKVGVAAVAAEPAALRRESIPGAHLEAGERHEKGLGRTALVQPGAQIGDRRLRRRDHGAARGREL